LSETFVRILQLVQAGSVRISEHGYDEMTADDILARDVIRSVAGPVFIREAARRVHRDVKGVHGDVSALLAAGLLNRTKGGAIEFPYEAVKVEFLLQAA
jgi:predicted transcriptional regulator